jgi:hypothetical protein
MISFASDLTHTADLWAGLWMALVVTISAVVLCPLLSWMLFGRTRHV